MDSSAGHNTPTVKGLYKLSFLTDSFLTRVYFALLIPALRLRLRAVSIWLKSNRNGSAPKKRVIKHFERTVIYHHRNDSHSTCYLSFIVTFFGFLQLVIHNTNDNLQRAESLFSRCNFLSKSKSYTLEETVINHIEKKILFWYSAVK